MEGSRKPFWCRESVMTLHSYPPLFTFGTRGHTRTSPTPELTTNSQNFIYKNGYNEVVITYWFYFTPFVNPFPTWMDPFPTPGFGPTQIPLSTVLYLDGVRWTKYRCQTFPEVTQVWTFVDRLCHLLARVSSPKSVVLWRNLGDLNSVGRGQNGE